LEHAETKHCQTTGCQPGCVSFVIISVTNIAHGRLVQSRDQLAELQQIQTNAGYALTNCVT